MSARLRGLLGRWLVAALILCLMATGAALAAGPLAHGAAKKRRADLVVSSAKARLASGRVTVSLVASNRGRRRAPASTAAIAWASTVVASPSVRLRTFSVRALKPRARRSMKVSLRVPAGSTGAFVVTVCLDVKKKVPESGGANNCQAAGTVRVPGGAALGEQQSSPTPTPAPTPTPTTTTPPPGSGSGPPAGTGTPGDTTAPETSIARGPVGVTATRTEIILFTSPESGVSFQCRLDAADWAACSSPITLTSLGDGLHIFEVRATDAAGNTDPTPASRTWTVDATPPETTITDGPAAFVNVTSAGFQFSASEAGGSFQCKVDTGAWTYCAPPFNLSGLAVGAHTFQVRATDAAGNTDPTPATRTWAVDQTPPQTTIGSGPSGVTTGPSTAFGFSSEAGATFECRLDGGNWAACASPEQLTGLADGPHTFDVRAIDAAGNADTTPATRTWTVDATAPDTSIDSGPPATAGSAGASFGFSSADAGATFECRIDGAAWAACTSPQAYSGLADGPHVFDVRATDALGNTDATPASQAWTVDTTAPQTTIDSGPSTTVASQSASFGFSSSEAGSTFECQIDGGTWGPCASPKAYSGLADGPHTFAVRATDAVGNLDATPASQAWAVDATAPQTTIDTGPSGPVASSAATFSFSSPESSTFECSLDGAPFGSCTSPVMYTGLADGPHTVEVRATDAVGNVEASPASRTWSVDTAAPQTTIVSGPSGATNTSAATFTFTSSEAGSTFECQIDGGAWEACTSPTTYTALADGSHAFGVRATDAVGNLDSSPASSTWTIDATAPQTTIDSGPPATVSSAGAAFTFSSSEGNSTFQCRLDGGAWAPCTSPSALSGLADGAHTFEVRATDTLGNTDATPASQAWTVDTTPPQTTIGSGPSGTVNSADAAFTFSSSEPGSTFECRVDAGAWGSCTSPAAYSNLADGAHTFDVRATDAVGNPDATAATQAWTVDTTPPDTSIGSGPSGTVNSSGATFTFSSPDAGATFECRVDGAAFSACGSPKSYTNLADGSHTFQVRAVDGAGNPDPSPASQSWSSDTTPPQTTIDGGPSNTVASAAAAFSFSASENGSTLECQLDGGGWTSCASPASYSGLGDGLHTFEVRATDALGNVDPTPATRTWTVDTTAPDTVIDSGPTGTVATAVAEFAFSSPEAGATFECRLDGAPFAPCTSPAGYSGLVDGPHTFDVQATDAAGNVDPTPASQGWTVATQPAP